MRATCFNCYNHLPVFFVHKTSVKTITRVQLALVANFTVALFALCLPQVHLPQRPGVTVWV